MNWNTITDAQQLNTIDEESKQQKVFIFKHSTTCSISKAALNRLERNWSDLDDQLGKAYYIDLLRFRSISNEIAERYQIIHESPQVMIIENGRCKSSDSHFDISYEGLVKSLS